MKHEIDVIKMIKCNSGVVLQLRNAETFHLGQYEEAATSPEETSLPTPPPPQTKSIKLDISTERS